MTKQAGIWSVHRAEMQRKWPMAACYFLQMRNGKGFLANYASSVYIYIMCIHIHAYVLYFSLSLPPFLPQDFDLDPDLHHIMHLAANCPPHGSSPHSWNGPHHMQGTSTAQHQH